MSSYRNRNCDYDCDCSRCCPQTTRTTITLAANPPTVCIENNNTTFLSGQVLVNGQPANREIVEFSVNPNLGIVIPLAVITTSSGNFTAVFIATNGPGIVTLTATVPDCDRATTSIQIPINNCQQPSNATIILNANPNGICSNGSVPSTSTISGQVLVNGQPAGGVTVNFSLNNPSIGTLSTFTITTDPSGNFFDVTFTPTKGSNGTANVIATLPDFSGVINNVPISIRNTC
ncbi:DUF4198 domain-containing protein [Priestia megaterium]|uniref:DUF4198 domain-containing protein n=1 Tax=Priestia megaterium TaxID=1404 RepID=UPI001140D29D|nr:hypothetical protein [Priestia megaterium]